MAMESYERKRQLILLNSGQEPERGADNLDDIIDYLIAEDEEECWEAIDNINNSLETPINYDNMEGFAYWMKNDIEDALTKEYVFDVPHMTSYSIWDFEMYVKKNK